MESHVAGFSRVLSPQQKKGTLLELVNRSDQLKKWGRGGAKKGLKWGILTQSPLYFLVFLVVSNTWGVVTDLYIILPGKRSFLFPPSYRPIHWKKMPAGKKHTISSGGKGVFWSGLFGITGGYCRDFLGGTIKKSRVGE